MAPSSLWGATSEAEQVFTGSEAVAEVADPHLVSARKRQTWAFC
jgi:hypothetical protein